MLEIGRKMVSGELPQAPVGALIGFKLIEVEPGYAVVELEANESHANPMGTLHGGILCDIADAAMGIAFASFAEEGESFTTIEMKINFLKPVWKTRLRASGKVVKRGKSIGYVECDIRNDQGDLIARASSTCMMLRGPKAAGR